MGIMDLEPRSVRGNKRSRYGQVMADIVKREKNTEFRSRNLVRCDAVLSRCLQVLVRVKPGILYPKLTAAGRQDTLPKTTQQLNDSTTKLDSNAPASS